MRRVRLAIVACVSMLAVALSAVPAQAVTDPVARAGTSAVSHPELMGSRAAAMCPSGSRCIYDDDYGDVLLLAGLRCGEHNLVGGRFQNTINFVDNNSTANMYLDILRADGSWQEYAHVRPWERHRIYTNEIDRIRIYC